MRPMNGRIAASLFIAGSFGLVGCEKWRTPPTANSQNSERKIAKITRTGGIAGGTFVVWLHRDGVFNEARNSEAVNEHGFGTRGSHSDGQISDPAQAAELWAAIDSAMTLRSEDFPAPDVADAFVFALELGGRQIRWNEAARDLPRELQRVSDAFRVTFSEKQPN